MRAVAEIDFVARVRSNADWSEEELDTTSWVESAVYVGIAETCWEIAKRHRSVAKPKAYKSTFGKEERPYWRVRA